MGADNSKISELSGVTCNGTKCVAVGVYNLNIFAGPIGGLPLAAISYDGGVTFETGTRPALPGDADTINKDAFLFGVSCPNTEHCVAVGTYNLNDMTSPSIALPYAVISHDGGQTFTEASVPPLPTSDAMPTATQWAELRGVTCIENRCIAVGFYNRNDTMASPLVELSYDGGKTFTKTYRPSLPIDADPTKNAQLNGISCVNSRCVATGNYNVTFDINNGNPDTGVPFILISDDKGETFTTAYQPNLSGLNVNYAEPVLITGINCTYQTCVAVGGYNLGYEDTNIKSGSPFSIFSINRGSSFTAGPALILPTGANRSLGANFGPGNQFN